MRRRPPNLTLLLGYLWRLEEWAMQLGVMRVGLPVTNVVTPYAELVNLTSTTVHRKTSKTEWRLRSLEVALVGIPLGRRVVETPPYR